MSYARKEKSNDQYSEEETARRATAALREIGELIGQTRLAD
jgi:hypothetical protein